MKTAVWNVFVVLCTGCLLALTLLGCATWLCNLLHAEELDFRIVQPLESRLQAAPLDFSIVAPPAAAEKHAHELDFAIITRPRHAHKPPEGGTPTGTPAPELIIAVRSLDEYCPPCKSAKEHAAALGFRVQVRVNPKLGRIPVLYWPLGKSWGRMEGWPGPEKFLEYYISTGGTLPAQLVPGVDA